jgi:hypothetical protein
MNSEGATVAETPHRRSKLLPRFGLEYGKKTQTPVRALSQLLIGKEQSAALRDRILGGATGLFALRFAFSSLSFGASILLARLWVG